MLRVLNGVSVPLHAARIAALAGLSKPATATALGDLQRIGLVDGSPAGRSVVYWLVRDNVYVQRVVRPAFGFESDFPDMLESDLRSWFGQDAMSVVLFGSYARGDQADTSDVDVVLVGDSPEAKERLDAAVDERGSEFDRRYGASLSAIVYDPAQAGDLWRRAPALLESIAKDGIVVSGLFPQEWRGHGQKR